MLPERLAHLGFQNRGEKGCGAAAVTLALCGNQSLLPDHIAASACIQHVAAAADVMAVFIILFPATAVGACAGD